MNPNRVKEIVDAYGADESRWPDAERTAALDLLEQSEVLRAYREEARGLDALLDTSNVAPASVDLEAAILATAPTPTRRPATRHRPLLRRWFSRPAMIAVGGMACMLVGATTSYSLTTSALEAERAEAFLAYGYGESYGSDGWLGEDG